MYERSFDNKKYKLTVIPVMYPVSTTSHKNIALFQALFTTVTKVLKVAAFIILYQRFQLKYPIPCDYFQNLSY